MAALPSQFGRARELYNAYITTTYAKRQRQNPMHGLGAIIKNNIP
jgi:hypothetical protein